MKAWAVFLVLLVSACYVYSQSQDIAKTIACLCSFTVLIFTWDGRVSENTRRERYLEHYLR